MTEQPRTHPSGHVDVRRLRGLVPAAEIDAADQALDSVVARWRDDVTDVRMRLTGPNFGIGPGLAQINLTVGGALSRVQVTGRSISDAVAAAVRRLEWKLHLLLPVPSSELARWPDPQYRPLSIALPGRITRLKSVPLATITPAAATRTLVAMDYGAHLFTDSASGDDAVIYRGGPSGLRLTRQRSMRPPAERTQPAIIVHPQRPPTMSAAEAVDWLVTYYLPHVFFTDRETHRGSLLYRRYDGNLTLVAPQSSTTGMSQ